MAVVTAFSGCGGTETETEAVTPVEEERSSVPLEEAVEMPAAPEVVAPEPAPPAMETPMEEPAVSPVEDAAAEAPAPDTAAVDGAAAVAGETDPLHAQLIGTTWVADGMDVTFRSADKVFISGGAVAAISPTGIEADYTYANGTITASAFGQTKTLTWDGTTLTMDGKAAERKQS